MAPHVLSGSFTSRVKHANEHARHYRTRLVVDREFVVRWGMQARHWYVIARKPH